MNHRKEEGGVSSAGLPMPAIDLMFCMVAVLILSLSLVFKNRPNTDAVSPAVLPRAPGESAAGSGKGRVTVTARPDGNGGVVYAVGQTAITGLPPLREHLRQLSPASVVFAVDVHTPPDPLTAALRLLETARQLSIPAHLAYRPEAGEGGPR